MSVGVLPHVRDTRTVEQAIDDYLAYERAKAMERQMPTILAVVDVLAGRLPEFAALDADQKLVIAHAAVEAVESGW